MNIKLYTPLAIHEMGNRKNQEDFICPVVRKATPDDRLFIVCDGMGGHEHGEVASETFATALSEYFAAHVMRDDVLDDGTLAAAVEHAYTCLDAKDDGSYKKMGTTLTLVYFHRGGVTAAHIGDSRIYHIRPSEGLLYVSRDHSLVYDLYQSGEISYDEMKTSNQKNIITRAVQPGEDNRVKPDVIHITDVKAGDWFYLCSDGMLEQMEDEELFRLLSSDASDEKKRQQLIAATTNNQDNHSAYLLHVKEVINEPNDALPAVNEEKTARCNALNIKPVPAATDDGVAVVNAEPAVAEPVQVTAPAPASKKRWWPLLLALVALAVVAGVFYGMRSHGDDAQDQTPASEQTEGVKPIKPIEHVSSPQEPKTVKHPAAQAPAATPKKDTTSVKPAKNPQVKPADIVKPAQPTEPAQPQTPPSAGGNDANTGGGRPENIHNI